MYQTTLSPEAAIGHILRHNIADEQGGKALPKGRRLTVNDAVLLRSLGINDVPVAIFEQGDIHEDEAARQVAKAICGEYVNATKPAASRVNILASRSGVAQIDVAGLLDINTIDGITVATRLNHSFVAEHKRIATIKIIPFALPLAALQTLAEKRAHQPPIVSLQPLATLDVGIVLVGSEAAQPRIIESVLPSIVARVDSYGSRVLETRYVSPSDQAVADALIATLRQGAQLVIIAGETSIMDRDDVTPRGIRLAGGVVAHYGAPVEPGNLLLMAYSSNGVPILGAPGCVRSRDANIVDLLLPRLLAGETIGKADIIALGHGGLL